MDRSRRKFLIVGGAKCATTTLFSYLMQHHDVYMPKAKECRYFSNIGNRIYNPFTHKAVAKIVNTWEEYEQLYVGARGKIQGDISPDYLYYHENSIHNISDRLGLDVKIVIVLRDPVERAYSGYWHLRREKLTELLFDRYLEVEGDFNEAETWYGFYLKTPGLYSEAVAAYLKAFPFVKVIVFEDIAANSQGVLKDVLEFIGASPMSNFRQPAFTNKTGKPIVAWLPKVMHNRWVKQTISAIAGKDRLNDWLISLTERNYKKPAMTDRARMYLEDYYFQDVLKLEEVLGQKVPWAWVQNAKSAKADSAGK